VDEDHTVIPIDPDLAPSEPAEPTVTAARPRVSGAGPGPSPTCSP
jgi:hypothetical protein